MLFHSPYEAAAWAVIVARSGRAQARTVRTALSERYGATFELAGVTMAAFPSAEALLEIDEPIPGLTNEKHLRLQGIARAELEGRLDVAHLRELGPDEAMAELQQLRGIGPFSSSLIVLRAVGFTDVLPVEQPMRAARRRAGLRDHDAAELRAVRRARRAVAAVPHLGHRAHARRRRPADG